MRTGRARVSLFVRNIHHGRRAQCSKERPLNGARRRSGIETRRRCGNADGLVPRGSLSNLLLYENGETLVLFSWHEEDAPFMQNQLAVKKTIAPIDDPDEGEPPRAYAIATSNRIAGHDETSEDTRMTWEQVVGTTPTPGSVLASLAVVRES